MVRCPPWSRPRAVVGAGRWRSARPGRRASPGRWWPRRAARGAGTGPCSRLGKQQRGVARRGDLAPLVLAPELEVDGGPVAVGQVVPGDRAGHPVGVADVVEAPELAVERREPAVVAHPIGAEVDQPGLAHAAVVVDRRVAGPGRPFGVPVDSLLHVGDVQVVGSEEARDPLALPVTEPQRLDAVQTHAHPDVPADDVGDPQRTLDQRAQLVTLGDVLPPSGSAPAPTGHLGGDGGGDPARSPRRCTARSSVRSYLALASDASRSVRIISRYCADRTWAGVAKTSPVHSCTARPANSPPLSCTPTSALRRVTRCRAAAASTTPGSCRRSRREPRGAGRPSAGPSCRDPARPPRSCRSACPRR